MSPPSDNYFEEALRIFPTYNRVAALVGERLELGRRELGIGGYVKARAKSPMSVAIKVARKRTEQRVGYDEDPFAVMPDLAGARVVVERHRDVSRLIQWMREHLEMRGDIDDKADALEPDKLGYLGVHCQIVVSGEWGDPELAGLECEVQIHTLAQSAWATVSHPLVYKPVGPSPSRSVRYRVFRSVSLVSLFDDEITAALDEVLGHPDYAEAAMLETLRRAALTVDVGDDSDEDLSMEIIAILKGLYEEAELTHFEQLIERLLAEHGSTLREVIQRAGPRSGELVHQPEVVAIYDLLLRRAERLRAVWIESPLPLAALDSLATALGRPY